MFDFSVLLVYEVQMEHIDVYNRAQKTPFPSHPVSQLPPPCSGAIASGSQTCKMQLSPFGTAALDPFG